ncbi:MAG: hypothetical protein U9R00_03550 [Patescibacteria group bacterium]|nr:hypothetical protein [Patescibacteria group bacterium]
MIETFLTTNGFSILQAIFVLIGFLLPIPLAYIAYKLWHHYRQENFISGMEWVLLEIQVPREVQKTPAAMELVLTNAFYHQSFKGFWEEFIMGAPWMWFSLEMVSIDGKVHFFVRTPSRIRDLVETQIYAQYPQAKVIEAEDYTMKVPQYSKDGDWHMWGCEFKKLLDDVRPVKTWNKMEAMKIGTKEELKVDPLTSTIEFLGSLKKGQQMWVQIIVRQSIRTFKGPMSGKKLQFNEYAEEYLKDMLRPYTKVGKGTRYGGGDVMEVRAPTFIDPYVKAIVETVQQVHFDCGIRLIVLANKQYMSEYDFGNFRRASRLIFRQYAAPNLNEFNRINSAQFDSPWSDPTGLALTALKKRMLNFYRARMFFHPPIQYGFKYPKLISAFFPSGKPEIFVMSVAELATIFHFPGRVSETPTFQRIESKIAKPPTDLPT